MERGYFLAQEQTVIRLIGDCDNGVILNAVVGLLRIKRILDEERTLKSAPSCLEREGALRHDLLKQVDLVALQEIAVKMGVLLSHRQATLLVSEKVLRVLLIRNEVKRAVGLLVKQCSFVAEETASVEFEEVFDLLRLYFVEGLDADCILVDQILKSQFRFLERRGSRGHLESP